MGQPPGDVLSCIDGAADKWVPRLKRGMTKLGNNGGKAVLDHQHRPPTKKPPPAERTAAFRNLLAGSG